MDGEVLQVKVSVAILPLGSGAYDDAVEHRAFLRSFIDHLIDLRFGEFSVKTKEGTGNGVVVPVAPVGNVADGFLCPSPVPLSSVPS